MKVVMANDHGGVELAARFVDYFNEKGIVVTYLGVDSVEKSVDYPDIADRCVKEYENGNYDFGVLICGSGIGISVAANKHRGIVCALPQNEDVAILSREHNGANFIAFGGRVQYTDDPVKMLDRFLHTPMSLEDRHVRRREKIFK